MTTNSKRHAFLIMALVTLMMVTALPALAGTKVIAHSGVADATLSQGDLQKIFLGKQGSWSNGAGIEVAVISGGPAADEFLKTFVKKSPSQFKTFWKKAVFSGTGTAPGEFASDAEMVAWVAATPGAIGFVSDGAATDGCKTIAVQ